MFVNRSNIVSVLLMALVQSPSMAQQGRYSESRGSNASRVSQFPPDMFLTYHHASTATEGALRGQAALRYAEGTYLVNAGQADCLEEEARWFAHNNMRRWVEYRIGLRTWRVSERESLNAKQRKKNTEKLQARLVAYRLDANQLDHSTGQITWPRELRDQAYDVLREQVNELFHRNQMGYDAQGTILQTEFRKRVEQLSGSLRANRFKMERNDYLASQKFLCGLKYESLLRL